MTILKPKKMNSLELIGETIIPESEQEKIAALICSCEDPEHTYQICVKTVDSETMKHYNKRYRGLNETTDILSFVTADLPACEIEITDSEDEFSAKPIRICDIIIDINQLLQQKGIRNMEEEYRAVLIHGLLHLVGYDHIHSADAEKMKKKEEYYLRQTQGEL